MALPTLSDGTLKPLDVDLKPDELTIGDVRLMKGDIHIDRDDKSANVDVLVLLSGFLIRHTNWTEQEVNALKIDELIEVLAMVRSRERAASVPLASSDRSAPGPGATQTASPHGALTSSMPSNSDVILRTWEPSTPAGTSAG